VAQFLEKYGDEFIDLRTLRELSEMLFAVNFIIFGIVGWIALGWGLPAGGDTRPEWSIWLIWAPLGGLFFGGILGGIVWQGAAHPLGEFLFNRLHKREASSKWLRYIGHERTRRN